MYDFAGSTPVSNTVVTNSTGLNCTMQGNNNTGLASSSANPQGAPGTAGNPQGVQHQPSLSRGNTPNHFGITPNEYSSVANLIRNDMMVAINKNTHLRVIGENSLTFGDIGYSGYNMDEGTLFNKLKSGHENHLFRTGLYRTKVMDVIRYCENHGT